VKVVFKVTSVTLGAAVMFSAAEILVTRVSGGQNKSLTMDPMTLHWPQPTGQPGASSEDALDEGTTLDEKGTSVPPGVK